jgi:hypothetical protein
LLKIETDNGFIIPTISPINTTTWVQSQKKNTNNSKIKFEAKKNKEKVQTLSKKQYIGTSTTWIKLGYRN